MNKDETYAWVITRDHLEDKAVTIIGPGESEYWRSVASNEEGALKVLSDPSRKRFQMLDDDGNIYYEGYMVYGWSGQTTGFEPLDEYGAPNAGCTTIRYQKIYQEVPEWETL